MDKQKSKPSKFKPQFKAGDVVRLKSGGPAMTVEFPAEDTDYRVGVCWFDGVVKHDCIRENLLRDSIPDVG